MKQLTCFPVKNRVEIQVSLPILESSTGISSIYDVGFVIARDGITKSRVCYNVGFH